MLFGAAELLLVLSNTGGEGVLIRLATCASRLLIRTSATCFSSVTRFKSLIRRNCEDSCLVVLEVDAIDVTFTLVDDAAVLVIVGTVVVMSWSGIRVTTELMGVESSVSKLVFK